MKAAWAWPAQIATWLASMVLLFVIKPPRLTVSDPATGLDRFVEFALAIIIGIVFAVLPRAPSETGRRRSALASGLLLVAAIAAFAVYLYLSGHWTCRYDAGEPMVIGATLTSAAARYAAANPGLECARLIQDFAGQTSLIWPRDELVDRRLILSGLFSVVVLTFALAALFMLRALTRKPMEPESDTAPVAP
jgi:hypothetical protein